MSRFSDPATLAFEDWERDRKEKRNRYWAMLRSAKDEFLNLTEHSCLEHEVGGGAFYYYLQQNYGLKIELIDGRIAGEYAVIDEKKYLLFLMKFGS